MERFEYQITSYPTDTFQKVVYFCSEKGVCGLDDLPANEPQVLVDILNEQGLAGWELIQLMFGSDGVLACWKRRLAVCDSD